MKKHFFCPGFCVALILLSSCSGNDSAGEMPAEDPAEFSIDTSTAIGRDSIAAPLDSLGVKETRKDNTSTTTEGNNKKAAK